MRKLILVIIAALFTIGIAFRPTPAHAVEGKVGLMMMYDWWKPGFLVFENSTAAKLFGTNSSDKLTGSFMLGPTFAIGLGRSWTLGTTALFGLSRNEFEYTSLSGDVDILRRIIGLNTRRLISAYIDIGDSQARRYDWDVNFDYAFHKYLSLLIGIRFNYADGEGEALRLHLLQAFAFDYMQEEYTAWYLGPSVGLGFHYEFVKGLVLNLGVSALVQFGQYDNERKFLNNWLLLVPYDYSVGYFCIGLDNHVRLGYLISKISLEIFVGGRYAFLPHIEAGDDYPAWDVTYKKKWIGGEVEHWGGIFFGAAYKF